jgi:hypothetical protein
MAGLLVCVWHASPSCHEHGNAGGFYREYRSTSESLLRSCLGHRGSGRVHVGVLTRIAFSMFGRACLRCRGWFSVVPGLVLCSTGLQAATTTLLPRQVARRLRPPQRGSCGPGCWQRLGPWERAAALGVWGCFGRGSHGLRKGRVAGRGWPEATARSGQRDDAAGVAQSSVLRWWVATSGACREGEGVCPGVAPPARSVPREPESMARSPAYCWLQRAAAEGGCREDVHGRRVVCRRRGATVWGPCLPFAKVMRHSRSRLVRWSWPGAV